MAAGQPTDRQLRALVNHIARVWLEVERGLRPPDHLERLLTRGEYDRHRDRPVTNHHRHPRAGPVTGDDVAGMRIDRTVDGRVTANINTREHDNRWGALTLQLTRTDNGWVVDHLQRLHRGLQPVNDRHQADRPQRDLDQRIARTQQERQLVAGAWRATTTRLDDLAAGRHTQHETASQSELRELEKRWADRLDELDHELHRYRHTRDLNQQLDRTDDNNPEIAHETTDDPVQERLSRILGSQPDDPDVHAIWARATEQVDAYRHRWNITDTNTLLGPQPDYHGQARDRQRVADILADAVEQLRHHRPDRDCEPAHELGPQTSIPDQSC